MNHDHGRLPAPRTRAVLRHATCIGAMALAGPATALQIQTANPDLKIGWDNTVKYSTAFRTAKASSALTSNPGLDDGDRNFSRGLISNRLDLLSELDVRYRNVGVRISGAAWYDTVYNRRNDNDSAGLFGPGTSSVNQSGGAYNRFTSQARKLHGRNAEVLDAFVFGNFDVAGRPASVRLGRHTVLYGETLFMGANGISAAQSPIDIVKAMSVPGTQFKELIRPVPQISGSLQLTNNVSVGAYYQFRWEPDRIPAAGSYFSFADNADNVNVGARNLFPAGLGVSAPRRPDQQPKDSGQGGMQLRWRLDEADIGFYAVRFHARSFDQYTYLSAPPDVAPIGYQLVYPQGIRAFGASYSQTFGDVNVAAEVSTRRNMPFVSQVGLFPAFGQSADNSGSPGYAVGNSAHAQVSILWQVPRTPLFGEANVAAEVAWNRALSVTRNAGVIDPNSTRDAWALRLVATPVYRQVFPGVDLEAPIGVGYNPAGRSRVVPLFNAPASAKGGDLSLGLNAVYRDQWRFGINYTHYYGSADGFVNSAGTQRNYKQFYRDRNFISLNLRTTF